MRQTGVESESERSQNRWKSSTGDAEPHSVHTRCHAEGLRLAATAKLPPLISIQATRKPRGEESRGRERETVGMAVRVSEAGLGRWIWMLVKGSQTVRIKGKQWAVRLKNASEIQDRKQFSAGCWVERPGCCCWAQSGWVGGRSFTHLNIRCTNPY